MKLDSFAVIDGTAIFRFDGITEHRIMIRTVYTRRTQTERYWCVGSPGGHTLTIQVPQKADRIAVYIDDANDDQVANAHHIPWETAREIFAALGIDAPQPWLSCPVCYGDLAQSEPGRFDCAECMAKAAEVVGLTPAGRLLADAAHARAVAAGVEAPDAGDDA